MGAMHMAFLQADFS